MSAGPKLAPVYQFGPYVFDVSASQLFKRGYKLKIAGQPLQILTMLLERPYQVITREEIRERLWSDGTFVDFENGLNKAINKLRQALNDSAEKPVYIETLPRKGYRFIAQLGSGNATGSLLNKPESPTKVVQPSRIPASPNSLRSASEAKPVNRLFGRRYLIWGIAVMIVVAAFTLWFSQSPAPNVRSMTQLTNSGRAEHWAWINSDGSRVYFNERHGSRWPLMQTSVSGGESVPAAAPFADTIVFSISPDHSEMLVGSFTAMTGDLPLSIMKTQGGALQRVGDLRVDRAVWFPDGKRILFTRGAEVFSSDRDGTHEQKLFSVAGTPYAFSWHPGGRSFRFTIADTNGRDSLWEANADGTNVHPLLPGWDQGSSPCCGNWMPDGRNYVFSAYEGNRRDIWVLRAPKGLHFWEEPPIQITFGPNQFAIPLPIQDGSKLLVFGSQPRSTLMRFDLGRQQFVPFLGGISAIDIAFSRDGQWVAYIAWPELVLWRSRLDGSERMKLTPSRTRALRPRWSPDGKKILFAGQQSDGNLTAYIVDSSGGMPRPVLEHDSISRCLPEWSPDGRSVLLDSNFLPDQPIVALDVKTGTQTEIPGSRGITGPRWSPDGRFLSARSSDETKLMLFDTMSQRWSELRSSKAVSRYEWDRSGRYLYFQEILDSRETVSRFDTRTGVISRAFDFSKPLEAGAMRCGFEGLTPDGQFLGSIRTGWADIYVLDVDLP